MSGTTERQAWMGVLARAPAAELERLCKAAGIQPRHDWLRRPEIGAVMVRGRKGASGAPFNLGEMTVTRCALRLATGEVGHAVVQGRDKAHATRAALVDALMQTEAAEDLRAAVIEPLARAAQAARAGRARKAASTRVEFFTVARGE